jgi:hypothetical protein
LGNSHQRRFQCTPDSYRLALKSLEGGDATARVHCGAWGGGVTDGGTRGRVSRGGLACSLASRPPIRMRKLAWRHLDGMQEKGRDEARNLLID